MKVIVDKLVQDFFFHLYALGSRSFIQSQHYEYVEDYDNICQYFCISFNIIKAESTQNRFSFESTLVKHNGNRGRNLRTLWVSDFGYHAEHHFR